MADLAVGGQRVDTIPGMGQASLRIMAARLNQVRGDLRDAADLGFSHVLLPPPWLAGAHGPFLTANFDAVSLELGLPDLAALVGIAQSAGIGLLIDVVVDGIDAASALAGAPGSPFVAPTLTDVLDARRHVMADRAAARLAGPQDVAILADWWAARLSAWQEAGVAGFRLLGLSAFQTAFLAPFFAALRLALPAALLLPWTPGLPREAVRSLQGRGADGVFASLPWWDGKAGWLWDELDDLLPVAPVLGMDAPPPGAQTGTRRQFVPPGLAACLGQGWLHVPSGQAAPSVAGLNQALSGEPALAARLPPILPLGGAGPVLALLRADAAEWRSCGRAALTLINLDQDRWLPVNGDGVLPAAGGALAAFRDAEGRVFVADSHIELAPGESRLFSASARRPPGARGRADSASARRGAGMPRLAIEALTPSVDGGRFAVKAVAGETVAVQADIVFDGHEKISACLAWRSPERAEWCETPMEPLGNDRWQGRLPLAGMGRYSYKIVAWRDRFATFCDELSKKAYAGLDVALELQEGEALLRAAAQPIPAGGTSQNERVRAMLDGDLAARMRASDPRPFRVESAEIAVDAERRLARYASWYEVFPRSLSDDPNRHGTFADVERHLPRIRDMGFDVLYFPPISPIGRKNRKGRNNTLTPAADDPGSPYAVGSDEGGHDALHRELGTLEDFRRLQAQAAAHGLEIAIDFAIQCSPDHPWLKQHRGWFDWRPDGSIKYAENPPKKYEDIVNVDFYAEDSVPGLWVALCDVVLFWAEQGIRIFRVDNPHTKPFPFWEWMIGEVRSRYPDAMFLAEAFTRPKVMYRLAKLGFSQSYTYFTWRNEKAELIEYLTELNREPVSYFFRPHFFVNTPDINPVFLQGSGRPGFLIRAALAATLSGLFGVYNGFELCEASAVPGREEYLDSEKYQLRAWDWDRPGNIIREITLLNRIRRQNPALQTHLGVRFQVARNDQVLFYEKSTSDRSNVILVAVSLDPKAAQEADIELPLQAWELSEDGALEMQDLLTGIVSTWRGRYHRVRLTLEQPYAIWRARAA